MNALEKAIEICGGPTALAKRIKAKPNQLNNWRKRGVPARWCYAIEDAVEGRVTRKDLRPEDWHLIWRDLDSVRKDRRSTDKKV